MEENKNVQEEQNNQINTPNEVNSVKNNKGIVVALIAIILLLVAGLVYVLFFNKPKENDANKENNTQETEKDNNKENTDDDISNRESEVQKNSLGDYELVVYVSEIGQIMGSYTEDAQKVLVKVDSENAEFICDDGRDSGNFFLYNDNGLKIYDIKNKKSTNVDLSNEYKDYIIHVSDDNSKVIGISYLDSNSMAGYYNLSLKKELYKNKYKTKEYGFFYKVGDNYIQITSNKVVYLLSSTSEKVVMTQDDPDGDYYMGYSYGSYGYNGKYIYSLEYCIDDCIVKKLYTNDFTELYSKDLYTSHFDVYNNTLYIADDGYIKKYDVSGKLLSTSNKYDNIKYLVDNYVIYVKNGSLYVENSDDLTESKEICEWNDKWDFSSAGYYTRESLDIMGETNKKEGLYVIFYYGYDNDGNGIKDGKGNYGMEYCYTKDKQIADYPIKEAMGGRAKPVLYLYPEKETNVTVKFAHPEYLTTTYPKYINSWNVNVLPNGDMYDKDGKYYYALYWDETRYNEVDFKEGFYVEGKNAIKFLEEKLTYIGLNDKERNEFIMYWLPIMENNGKNLVYFELTHERENDNKLIIEPKPDSLLRVSIHIKKVNSKVNIKEQKLESFKRVGFTAVEWGGMTY